MGDSTLEKFPCDRSSAMDTLRKVQTSLTSNASVDPSHFDSFLQSPRFQPRRRSIDSDTSTGSSEALSPLSTRRHDHRLSHCSLDLAKPAVSLGPIAEETVKNDDYFPRMPAKSLKRD